MAADDDDDKDPKGSAGGDDEKKAKTYSQADLDDITSKARATSRRAAQKELLEVFGVDSIDELKAQIEKANKPPEKDPKEDAEVQKRIEKLEADLAKAQEANGKLRGSVLDSRKMQALLEAGMAPSAARRSARLLEIQEDSDTDEVKAAVSDLRKDMPQLFKAEEGDGDDDTGDDGKKPPTDKKPPSSNPGSPTRQPKRPSDTKERARARLVERHPAVNRKT
jgi:hypothetical protein